MALHESRQNSKKQRDFKASLIRWLWPDSWWNVSETTKSMHGRPPEPLASLSWAMGRQPAHGSLSQEWLASGSRGLLCMLWVALWVHRFQEVPGKGFQETIYRNYQHFAHVSKYMQGPGASRKRVPDDVYVKYRYYLSKCWVPGSILHKTM